MYQLTIPLTLQSLTLSNLLQKGKDQSEGIHIAKSLAANLGGVVQERTRFFHA